MASGYPPTSSLLEYIAVIQAENEILKSQLAKRKLRPGATPHPRASEGIPAWVRKIPAVLYGRETWQGDFIYVSPQLESLLGYQAAEWIKSGESWLNSVHPDDQARVLKMVNKSQEQDLAFSAEYRLWRKDGRWIWVHDEAAALRDEEGHTVLVQGVLIDITERVNRS